MSDEAVAALIRAHVQRYKEMDIQDVYKLLHQADFGMGHPVAHQRTTRELLEQECARQVITSGSSETILESIHPQGQIVRLNLRPYLIAQGNTKRLLDAMNDSGKIAQGDAPTMAAYWAIFQRMAESGGPLEKRYSAHTIALIGKTRAGENWPAAHHSPLYDYTYKPSYRVLTRAIAEDLLRKQNIAVVVI